MTDTKKQSGLPTRCALRGRLRYADFLAAGVLVVFAFLLFDSIRYSVHLPDECAYLTLTQRLMQGDRMITDEWHFTQFTALFQYLPFRCFLALTGGTEGIILAFRRLFVAVELLFFCYLYRAFRQYGAWAVLCAAVFTGYNAFGFLTLNYYFMGYAALVFVLTELLIRQEKRPLPLFFIGFVFACSVLMQPVAALFYFAFSVCVLLRLLGKKRGKDLFSSAALTPEPRLWLFLTAGILLCAAVFLTILLAGVDLRFFFQNFAAMFGDSEYDLSDPENWMRSGKIKVFFDLYGVVFPAASWGAALLAAVFRKQALRYRRLLFPACLAVSVASLLSVFFIRADLRIYALLLARPFFIANIGLVCYVFTKEKNRRLFAFWLAGVLFAFAEDVASEISILNGSILAAVPSVPLFADAVREINAERKAAPADPAARLSCASVLAALAVFVAAEAWHYSLVRINHYEEYCNVDPSASLTETLTAGPMRGLRTIPEISEKYHAALRDMDLVKQLPEGPFYVEGECPWYYLYVGRPYGVYSTYYVPADSPGRVLQYWEMHPDKLPACIYIPFFNVFDYRTDPALAEEKLRYFETVCEFEKTDGEAGYILRVLSWKLPPSASAPAG